jgi:hypothetical protein
MIGGDQRDHTLRGRFFLQEKRRYARLTEMMLYGLTAFSLATLPVAWLLHGFDGVRGAWNAPLMGALLGALAQWPAHFRRKAERELGEWEVALARIASSYESSISE